LSNVVSNIQHNNAQQLQKLNKGKSDYAQSTWYDRFGPQLILGHFNLSTVQTEQYLTTGIMSE